MFQIPVGFSANYRATGCQIGGATRCSQRRESFSLTEVETIELFIFFLRSVLASAV